MKKVNSVVWGIVLIAVGVIVALNALEIIQFDIFFDGWWTLLWIIPCTVNLFTQREKLSNLIWIAIGVFLLLCCQNVLEFDMLWKLALPAIIIFIGVKLIFGSSFSSKTQQVQKPLDESGKARHTCFAAFTGNHVDFDGQSFYGAELNAVFGGIEYDLRNALIPEDCVIKATAIFGGIDILLPEDVNVKVRSSSVFGGVGNKHSKIKQCGNVTVYIEGSGVFGGVDVK